MEVTAYDDGGLVQDNQGSECGVAGERAEPWCEGVAEHLAEEHEQDDCNEEDQGYGAPDDASGLGSTRSQRVAAAVLAVGR